MARTTVITFGPGRYERVTLELWPGSRSGGCRRIKGRYSGAVPVCCEHGWEHLVRLSGRLDEFAPSELAPPERKGRFALLARALRGDAEAGRELAVEAVEADLDWTWADPCPQDEEEPACS